MEIDESKFYELAADIARFSHIGKFSGKTPSLLLASERSGNNRPYYYKELSNRLGRVNGTKYLFSLTKLKEELRKLNREEVKTILFEWSCLAKNKNLDLRFTDKDFNSCVIGDQEALYKNGDSRTFVGEDTEEYKRISADFDAVFNSASSDHEPAIKAIMNGLL